jgi:hypothetical protein
MLAVTVPHLDGAAHSTGEGTPVGHRHHGWTARRTGPSPTPRCPARG